MISQGRSIVLRPWRSRQMETVRSVAEQERLVKQETLWKAVCGVFGVTVLALIGFRRYSRYLQQRRYEDHISAKEKR